jgi:glyoxylase-like metal-dependent hydrolase (beta-lactamase superfamily II)
MPHPANDILGGTMANNTISRRTVLIGAVCGTSAVSTGLGFPTLPASAKAPRATSQPATYYRFDIGDMQATVVSDGPLPLGEPSASFKGVTKEEVQKSLSDQFLNPDNVVLEQNVLVLNTGSRLVLFDSGMGTSKAFGPTTGRLQISLQQAGIEMDDIDDVICTHAHIDHIGGLANADNYRLFRNAIVHIAKADFDFWTDPAKLSGELKTFVAHARQNLLPYAKSHMKFVEDGKDVLPGVQAMAAPGHTVGHMVYIIKSGKDSLGFIGDTTHHHVLLTEKPRIEFTYDSDPKQAVESRLKVLDMIASTRMPMLAYHFPWPGVGNLQKQGDGYRYIARPISLVKPPVKKA